VYRIQVSTEGKAQLLVNQFVEGTKSGKKSTKEYTAEAMSKLHKDEKGRCCITEEMIKSCVLNGISMGGIKFGRKSLGQYWKAVAHIEPKCVPINNGVKEPDGIDVRPGRIPPGPRGSMVMLYRPLFKVGWTLDFTVEILDDRITEDLVHEAFNSAGLLAGLGAGRPDFGRFVVTKWEIVK
jgi:hypothetical protein